MNVFFGERVAAPGQGTARGGGTLGACPDIRPDGIYLDGQRVIRLGLQDNIGVGDVGDLLAYRQMWEPFIAAHLSLWREVNAILETMGGGSYAQKCPKGIFNMDQVSPDLSAVDQTICGYLLWSRIYTSDTNPLGIRPQWNAWKGRSSSEIVAGADSMLKWLQSVVMDVGGTYKDRLLSIAGTLGLAIELPEVPDFSLQQEIIARIEGAYISTKGVLQIIGYGAGEALKMAGSTAEAVAEGLQEAAGKLPEAVPTPWTWIGVTAVLAVVGGVLFVYYVPRRRAQSA